MAQNIPIYPGSASFSPGQTPFGFYDSDADFQTHAPQFANWAARRLGYPIVDVELQDINFYAALEEAVTEYSAQVSAHSARDVLLSIMGVPTGSLELQQQYVARNMSGLLEVAEEYATAAGTGGTLTHYTGSINVVKDNQVYDITDSGSVSFEEGTPGVDKIILRELRHQAPPGIVKYFDPFIGTGLGSQNLLEQFGFGQYSPGVNFLLMPMHFDVLRIQAIELNDQIRKSAYSFEVTGNRIKIFPTPNDDFKITFDYTLQSDEGNVLRNGEGLVSDHSTIPYFNMTYLHINDIGRQWIRAFGLAICKEMLGYIRGKYVSYPIPDAEVMLNSEDLINSANAEKDRLIDDLKSILDELSTRDQMVRKQEEAEAESYILSKVPIPRIYVR